MSYNVPFDKLELSVYPEVQKAQSYLTWLYVSIQTMSSDLVYYLRQKHRCVF